MTAEDIATASASSAGDTMAIVAVTLTGVAKVVTKLKMYPYFDIANYILMCMMVREDDRPTSGRLFSIYRT
jgi:hypothetical protein